VVAQFLVAAARARSRREISYVQQNGYSPEAALTYLFRTLEAELPYVVLRNYQGLPETWGNDIDILLQSSDLRRAQDLIKVCVRDKRILAQATVLKRWNFWSIDLPFSTRLLQIDLYTEMSKAWWIYADTELLLRERRRNEKGIWVPKLEHELLLIAAKELFSYGRIRCCYHARLSGHDPRLLEEEALSLFKNHLTTDGCAHVAHAASAPELRGRPRLRLGRLMEPVNFGRWIAMRFQKPINLRLHE
jgi:hypothetical protein